ncbi:MAG: DNA ligase (ATP) [Trizodia sp. TS-e1964]|nr:MAG: DNA ligase (ATP) [Trizodia sp. TS-e1964]
MKNAGPEKNSETPDVADELEKSLNEKYPNRPHNHSQTFPFHDLPKTLFNPLNDAKQKPNRPRRKQGPHGPSNPSPHEIRRNTIERFISRWRKEVGNDIYPALRLILPDKDRDRAMYGLKEKAIGKLLVKTMRIHKNSEDARNLLNWKLPGNSYASRMAGDFPGRCYEVISKRPLLTTYGTMTIGEVNSLLDQLAEAQKEETQLPIIEEFYRRMNADEMTWLIRIILRQMKVGASEKTFFDIWHPDAETLFNISSSLRRVCWELYDPKLRLNKEDTGVELMECFQPQLAQFQMYSFEKMVQRLGVTTADPTFWMEEKLDGERMQLHMADDDTMPGGKRFAFWSRKSKSYTYLYGESLEDENSALTRHLKSAFDPRVRSLIVDGEMITWDPELDIMVPFGTLKTAALSESRNPFSNGHRPLFRIFDMLYLNGECLTNYTLRDRRRALEASISSVHRRMELHTYHEARGYDEIEPMLRKIIAEASEGLVLKNPRSMYRLNDRNDDWMKVKPEYMTEFGETMDCIVIGGYYGTGRRGGILASYLCGLRVDPKDAQSNANPMKCYSFFKVGGGFRSEDYAKIKHDTDGKWKEWDIKRPPTDWIELGGGDLQFERPDVWIRPDESFVVSVKAASINSTESFRAGATLRFPRFVCSRPDKSWESAMSWQNFLDLKTTIDKESKKKEFVVAQKKKRVKRQKREVVIAGNDDAFNPDAAMVESKIFDGLNFYIMTESLKPEKKSKGEIEQLVKVNGGNIYQTHSAAEDMIRIGDRNESGLNAANSVDQYSDSYARDVTVEELRKTLEKMPIKRKSDFVAEEFIEELRSHGHEIGNLPGWIFAGLSIYLDLDTLAGRNSLNSSLPRSNDIDSELKLNSAGITLRFAGGRISQDIQDRKITHIVITHRSRVNSIREVVKSLVRESLPRIVTIDWVNESWTEQTLLSEERKFFGTTCRMLA